MWPRLTVWYKSFQGSTGFEGMKWSQKTAEACHCVKPRVSIGEGAALVTVEATEFRWPWREVEAWHREKNLKKAIGENTT